ncbi:MAG: transposase [Erysipelotrichaceae bacterium]|nr:transposase [Erysipelotrichaceae bacterium]
MIIIKLCHIVETSDFNRFKKASSYSSYIGVVPGEDSSSKSIRRLDIAKTGNVFDTQLSINIVILTQNKTNIIRPSTCYQVILIMF